MKQNPEVVVYGCIGFVAGCILDATPILGLLVGKKAKPIIDLVEALVSNLE